MNFVEQLMRSPLMHAVPQREYKLNKVRPAYRGSRGKYRQFLKGHERTINEIAEHMGYTYFGTRASVLRMVDRGDVRIVRESGSNGNKGRTPATFTWVGE